MMFVWRVGQFTEQSAVPQSFGADVIDWGWQAEGVSHNPPSSNISGITTVSGISNGSGITYSPGITQVPGITDYSSVAGSFAEPVILLPANQDIVTQSVEYAVSVYAPDDTVVNLYDGNTHIGSMTDEGAGYWSYAWTPTDVDFDVSLGAIGDVSGISDSNTVVVSGTNLVTQTLTSWTKSTGVTITGGQSDPDGGNSAYFISLPTVVNTAKFISKIYTSDPASTSSGFQIKVKKAQCGVLFIDMVQGGSHHSNCYLNLTTRETQGTRAFCKVVGEEDDGWLRVWFNIIDPQATGSVTINIYPCLIFGDNTQTATAGDGFYLYEPRTAGEGTLPFTDYQKLIIYINSVTGNITKWDYRHPFINSITDMASAYENIYTIKPANWNVNHTYPVLHALPALLIGTTSGREDVPTIFDQGGYADTYGCVIGMPDFSPATTPWYGQREDGTADQAAFTANVMPGFMQEFLHGSSLRDSNYLMGYSKSGVGAYSLLLRNSSVFGYAAGWDGPWNLNANWATQATGFLAVLMFTTQAQYQLYDPYTILTAHINSVSDKKRLCLLGYHTFSADEAIMRTLLDNNNIEYDYSHTDTGEHSYSSGWLPDGMAMLMSLGGL